MRGIRGRSWSGRGRGRHEGQDEQDDGHHRDDPPGEAFADARVKLARDDACDEGEDGQECGRQARTHGLMVVRRPQRGSLSQCGLRGPCPGEAASGDPAATAAQLIDIMCIIGVEYEVRMGVVGRG